MALHTELPIHKEAYDLLDNLMQLAKHLPRDMKVLIGTKWRDEGLYVLEMVFKANSSQDKVPYLEALISSLQLIELLCRLSRDNKYISVAQYAKAIKLTGSIGKQAGGWRKKFMSAPVS